MSVDSKRTAVLVTGASQGIGKATALRHALEGARVAIAARGAELIGVFTGA